MEIQHSVTGEFRSSALTDERVAQLMLNETKGSCSIRNWLEKQTIWAAVIEMGSVTASHVQTGDNPINVKFPLCCI